MLVGGFAISLKDFGTEGASDKNNGLVLVSSRTGREEPENETVERGCRSHQPESRINLFFFELFPSLVGMIRTLDLPFWSNLFSSLLHVSEVRSEVLFISHNQFMSLLRRTTFEAYFVVVVSVSNLAVRVWCRSSIEFVRCFDDAAFLTSIRSWTVWSLGTNFNGLSYLTIRVTPGKGPRGVS